MRVLVGLTYPLPLAHSQPHVDDGVLVSAALLRHTPLLSSSIQLGHPIGLGSDMHGPVEMLHPPVP